MKDFETKRLIIKNGIIDDFIKIFEYDYRKLENVGEEISFVKNDPEYIKTWFPNNIDNYYQELSVKNYYDLVIYLKDSMEPIGNITLDRYDSNLNSLEIACHLHPEYWGNGYMKEAISEILTFIFNTGIDNIIYSIDEGNIKSERLKDKLVFDYYGETKNSYIKNDIPINTYHYIMTKDKWNNLQHNKKHI